MRLKQSATGNQGEKHSISPSAHRLSLTVHTPFFYSFLSQVICATLSGCGSGPLVDAVTWSGKGFDTVIVDEACQVSRYLSRKTAYSECCTYVVVPTSGRCTYTSYITTCGLFTDSSDSGIGYIVGGCSWSIWWGAPDDHLWQQEEGTHFLSLR